MKTKTLPAYLLLFLAAALAGCSGSEPENIVRLATTTSVRDSGLLDVLNEEFQKNGEFRLQAIAVGSGQAMKLGKTGEADILWVHSPDDEAKFVEEGYGNDRTTFLHNDFVILGPAADPAKVRGSNKAAEAFRKIAAARAPFISRADQSGTHKKELKIWAAAGVKPSGEFYLEAGQGMAGTLSIAEEKKAYVLADRSTYLSMARNLKLAVLSEGDDLLINRYSLILVNPARFPKVNAAGARAYFDFVLSEPVKETIEKFGVEKYGQQLFFYDHAAK
ncbi:MAG: tungsten ABC transporter substrate-binding protein [Elusimicrobia bacterium HGW-Elusimicrobia-3]|nr:MAG: tungsten ABC transporter substrate-binding protein [Elusimicrobia bacterium HGW-Elusimicrobia-3]